MGVPLGSARRVFNCYRLHTRENQPMSPEVPTSFECSGCKRFKPQVIRRYVNSQVSLWLCAECFKKEDTKSGNDNQDPQAQEDHQGK